MGPPHELVAENAYRKAAAVAAQRPQDTVLGVDTEVAIGARVFGKPGSTADARAMLEELSGRRHSVLSGVCVFDGDRPKTAVASTVVEFRALERTLLDWYLETDEWRERAGGYAIQGRGAALVGRIEGDYFNVVGLPVPTALGAASVFTRGLGSFQRFFGVADSAVLPPFATLVADPRRQLSRFIRYTSPGPSLSRTYGLLQLHDRFRWP